MNEVKMLYKRAFNKIKKEENWCKGSFALNKDGYSIVESSMDAVKFCSIGIIRAEAHNKGYSFEVVDAVQEMLNRVLREKGIPSLVEYNDTHTHEEVMAVWAEANKYFGETK